MFIEYQIDKYIDNGYNINTFKNTQTIFWNFWIFDFKKFATEETFLDRL